MVALQVVGVDLAFPRLQEAVAGGGPRPAELVERAEVLRDALP